MHVYVHGIAGNNSLFIPGELKMFFHGHQDMFRICHTCAKLKILSCPFVKFESKPFILSGHGNTVSLCSFFQLHEVERRLVSFLM